MPRHDQGGGGGRDPACVRKTVFNSLCFIVIKTLSVIHKED